MAPPAQNNAVAPELDRLGLAAMAD
jgi:hypothetical protein